jgi:hypothetical protein
MPPNDKWVAVSGGDPRRNGADLRRRATDTVLITTATTLTPANALPGTTTISLTTETQPLTTGTGTDGVDTAGLSASSPSSVVGNTEQLLMDHSITTDHMPAYLQTTAVPQQSITQQATTQSTGSLVDPLIQFLGTTTTTGTDDGVTTVYTQLGAGALKPHLSFELIVPTITTNSLPPSATNATLGTDSTGETTFTYNNTQFSNSSSIGVASSYSRSSIYAHTSVPSQSVYRSSSRHYTSHFIPNTSSSRVPTVIDSDISTTIPTSTASSTISAATISSTTKTTVTEYLENITYTQVYVVTDSETTITTSILATTSFYVDSLSSTYSVSPAAITTDINYLKSMPNFDDIFHHNGLSGGSIAGIVIGSILGFSLLTTALAFLFKKKKKKPINSRILDKFKSHKDRYGFVKDFTRQNHNTDDYDNTDSDSLDDIDIERDIERDNSGGGMNGASHHHEVFENPMITSHKPPFTPPIPNRDNKPDLFITPPPHHNRTITPNVTVTTASPALLKRNSDEDLDMGLFDMKSAFNAMNTTDNNAYLIPKVPPARKNQGINSIDMMNYTVDNVPKTPLAHQLPIDRTMGVLYESPNEHCVWDEFESARNSGLLDTRKHSRAMSNGYSFSMLDSPIESEFPEMFDPFYQPNTNGRQLNSISDGSNANPNTNANTIRVRSGSGATRYEYLANNVHNFKHELEKERLASPLKETHNFGALDHQYEDQIDVVTDNVGKIPPPVPRPRKTNHQ